MKYLITADDFGMSESTNTTILRGIDEGIISSTNIMMNMPYLNGCQELLKRKSVFVGIHWNLTTGKPVSPVESVPSLVDSNGNMYRFPIFKEKAYKGEIKLEDIRTELKAQLDSYIENYGLPDYWNTHNHTQMVTPIFETMVNLAAEYNVCRMRNNHKLYRGVKLNFAAKNLVIDSIYKAAKKRNMRMPDGLISFDDKFSRYSIKSYFLKGDGIAEIMIHVASEVDSEYFGGMTDERIQQMNFYFSSEFKQAVAGNVVFKQ